MSKLETSRICRGQHMGRACAGCGPKARRPGHLGDPGMRVVWLEHSK